MLAKLEQYFIIVLYKIIQMVDSYVLYAYDPCQSFFLFLKNNHINTLISFTFQGLFIILHLNCFLLFCYGKQKKRETFFFNDYIIIFFIHLIKYTLLINVSS